MFSRTAALEHVWAVLVRIELLLSRDVLVCIICPNVPLLSCLSRSLSTRGRASERLRACPGSSIAPWQNGTSCRDIFCRCWQGTLTTIPRYDFSVLLQ